MFYQDIQHLEYVPKILILHMDIFWNYTVAVATLGESTRLLPKFNQLKKFKK